MVSLLALPASVLADTGLEPLAAPTPMVAVAGGAFFMGSTRAERDYGYRLDEMLHGSTTARRHRWFEVETRRRVTLPVYRIDREPVTNAAYAAFVADTGHAAPFVSEAQWRGYGLVHDYAAVRRFLWRGVSPPPGREQHPVVLVSHTEAQAYCAWRGVGERRTLGLPSEAQWEKAARGTHGRYFPWGNEFDAKRLNSYDAGPFDTVAVGRHSAGRSPYGVLDMAGQVFEWTSTPLEQTSTKRVVKGGSWDDLPGVTRAAARHGRPPELRHILIGFRCAGP